jgi:hypothetical protein
MVSQIGPASPRSAYLDFYSYTYVSINTEHYNPYIATRISASLVYTTRHTYKKSLNTTPTPTTHRTEPKPTLSPNAILRTNPPQPASPCTLLPTRPTPTRGILPHLTVEYTHQDSGGSCGRWRTKLTTHARVTSGENKTGLDSQTPSGVHHHSFSVGYGLSGEPAGE